MFGLIIKKKVYDHQIHLYFGPVHHINSNEDWYLMTFWSQDQGLIELKLKLKEINFLVGVAIYL